MKKLTFLFLAASAVALSGCSDDEPGNKIPKTRYFEPTAEVSRANEEINKFSVDFFGAVANNYEKVCPDTQDDNFMVSPLSATIALSLLANSGDDACTDEITRAMGVENLETLNATCKSLMQYLAWQEHGEVLEMANSVWYSDRYTVNPSYLNTLAESYYAKASSVDFTDTQKAVKTINNWAAKSTHNLIPCVLNDLPASTSVVLANALYYKGRWDEPFDQKKTRDMAFEGSKATTTVKMMHSDYQGEFYDTEYAKAVNIPFARNTGMIIVRPADGITAEELSRMLDHDKWEELLGSAARYKIHLDLPKFKIESKANIGEAFPALGISTDIDRLEKMGINDAPSVAATQFTYTAVNEEGAEAAAVTIGGLDASPGPRPINGEVTFIVDCPFLFFIRDRITGTVLMAGRVCNL